MDSSGSAASRLAWEGPSLGILLRGYGCAVIGMHSARPGAPAWRLSSAQAGGGAGLRTAPDDGGALNAMRGVQAQVAVQAGQRR